MLMPTEVTGVLSRDGSTLGRESQFSSLFCIRRTAGRQRNCLNTFSGFSSTTLGPNILSSGSRFPCPKRLLISRGTRQEPVSTSRVGRTTVFTYLSQNGSSFEPDPPFVLLRHNSIGSGTTPVYDGGLFASTHAGQSAAAKELGFKLLVITAGVAVITVSADGEER